MSDGIKTDGLLGRENFVALTTQSLDKFISMQRRGQVPMGPPSELAEEDAWQFGYTPAAAFLLNLALDLRAQFDMQPNLAAEIAINAFRVFASTPGRDKKTGKVFTVPSRWPDIARTSLQVFNGEEPDEEVLFFAYDVRGSAPEPVKRRAKTRQKPPRLLLSEALVNPRGMITDIGTITQIAIINPKATNLIAISLTRVAAKMRQRAAKAKIDLSEFWTPTPRDE